MFHNEIFPPKTNKLQHYKVLEICCHAKHPKDQYLMRAHLIRPTRGSLDTDLFSNEIQNAIEKGKKCQKNQDNIEELQNRKEKKRKEHR